MNQEQIPLYERLIEFNKEQPISFHVPGHKNGHLYNGWGPDLATIAKFDVTELTGLDDLHAPDGVIAKAQRLLAAYYQTRRSYFLVNGTTVGNMAMILACCQEGEYVLVQRDCHQSILNGLHLAKLKPVFIGSALGEGNKPKLRVEMVRRAFQMYPDIRACLFTYPNYYGQIYELEAMINIAHDNQAFVLVDEAHGAHFSLGAPFPHSSLNLGADIVVHSAHKTLPAFTMGSYLHINSDRVPAKRVEKYLKILQTSSPSYLIMASLDMARHYLATFSKEDIHYTQQQIQGFIKGLGRTPGIQIYSSPDPLKLMVRHSQMSGYELQTIFEQAGLYPELADPLQILLIFPLLKVEKSYPFNDALDKLQSLPWTGGQAQNLPRGNIIWQEGITELALSYAEMEAREEDWIDMNASVGRVAAQMVTPYPPGIPLVLPGEEITMVHIKQLKKLMELGARFQGEMETLRSGKIAVFK